MRNLETYVGILGTIGDFVKFQMSLWFSFESICAIWTISSRLNLCWSQWFDRIEWFEVCLGVCVYMCIWVCFVKELDVWNSSMNDSRWVILQAALIWVKRQSYTSWINRKSDYWKVAFRYVPHPTGQSSTEDIGSCHSWFVPRVSYHVGSIGHPQQRIRCTCSNIEPFAVWRLRYIWRCRCSRHWCTICRVGWWYFGRSHPCG